MSSGSSSLTDRYRALRERMAADPDMALDVLRSLFEDLGTATAEPSAVSYEEVDAGGVPALWCLPVAGSPGAEGAGERVLLYTHGGGFVASSASSHRRLAGHLAREVGARVLVIDYRRAPEHPFPAQIEDATAAWTWLREHAPSARTAVVGDSAGGNLAIALGVRLTQLGSPLPDAVVAFSPWLDMEHKSPSLAEPSGADALIDQNLTALMTQLYLGGDGSPTDPLANPLHADLSGFPPTYVAVGADEALLDDSRRFVERARAAGVEVELEIGPGGQHIYPIAAGRDPRADTTVTAVSSWLRAVLDRGDR